MSNAAKPGALTTTALDRRRGFALDQAIGMTVALAIILLIGAGIVAIARAEGRIDYCLVRSTSIPGQSYEVVGHRPWRWDAEIGYVNTPGEAEALMHSSSLCPKEKP